MNFAPGRQPLGARLRTGASCGMGACGAGGSWASWGMGVSSSRIAAPTSLTDTSSTSDERGLLCLDPMQHLHELLVLERIRVLDRLKRRHLLDVPENVVEDPRVGCVHDLDAVDGAPVRRPEEMLIVEDEFPAGEDRHSTEILHLEHLLG